MDTLIGDQAHVNPIGPLLVLEIGKLQGMQTAMLTTISQIQSTQSKMNEDLERKHEQNQLAISNLRAEHIKIMEEHSKEDDDRFNRVNRIIWASGGIFGFIQFILLLANLWKNWN